MDFRHHFWLPLKTRTVCSTCVVIQPVQQRFRLLSQVAVTVSTGTLVRKDRARSTSSVENRKGAGQLVSSVTVTLLQVLGPKYDVAPLTFSLRCAVPQQTEDGCVEMRGLRCEMSFSL
jgi:hypothetical protein